MEQPKKTFWQKHPGFDVYSLFWLLLFLVLVALGRFYLPLLIPALVVLVYLLTRLLSKNQQNARWKTPGSSPSSAPSSAGSGAGRFCRPTRNITTSSAPPAARPCACPGDWER